jgi:hypothetical protein
MNPDPDNAIQREAGSLLKLLAVDVGRAANGQQARRPLASADDEDLLDVYSRAVVAVVERVGTTSRDHA